SNAKEVNASNFGRMWLAKQLETERAKRKLATVDTLETDPKWRERYIRWRKLDELHMGLLTAQQKLHCEGWLVAKEVSGEFGWRMGDAVEYFQRRNFLMPTERLDKETREAMLLDSRELDFRLALRVLRERVVEAAGIIEDGTAGNGPQPVLGRVLDPAAMRAARGHKPMANAAPDLVGAATEAAAKQLGWTGPAEVRAFFDKFPAGTRVAIALPPVPSYYKPHMELSVAIDRGDIYYEDRPKYHYINRRPTLVLYVDDAGTKRPLVRWPTTIGGWADHRMKSGWLVQKWKESEVGPRIWRDLTAAPTWLPPKTTPDKDLVRNLYNGHWALKTDLLGPGPRSAYGMVLFEHLQIVKLRDGTERLDNNGIGTHGSSSVTSIVSGTSHGCHRLYNQLAVRLADFVLHHREYVVKGEEKVMYRRNIWHRESFKAEVDTRGFVYEMTPPIPVSVSKGNILSKKKTPPRNSAPARP
ncbi:MAG TPA: L,D-transpeptidase family protein, partial [Kofleriaceae bacterium]